MPINFIEEVQNLYCETAKHCYFHRNSLTNKLDKIQKETGYNMRSFNEAVALRFYIAANKVLK